jgi:hypothetical protein
MNLARASTIGRGRASAHSGSSYRKEKIRRGREDKKCAVSNKFLHAM